MRKIFRDIHLWLSVPFGVIITLVCFSGAMLVFEDEITRLCRHDLYYVDGTGTKALPAGRLMAEVSRTLPDSVSVTGMTVFSDPGRAYKVSLSKPRRAAVYVDQYTGEIKGRYERPAFFTVMFRLHRWLLGSMSPGGGVSWGKMAVGVSTVMFIFVLVSGVVIWWPRTRKALKKSLRITASHGTGRFLHGVHVAGGMYAFVLLSAMALTGLTWSFQWYRTAFYAVFGVEMRKEKDVRGDGKTVAAADGRQGKGGGSKVNDDGKHADASVYGIADKGGRDGRDNGGTEKAAAPFSGWQYVCDRLRDDNPGYEQITVSDGKASVYSGRLGNRRAADKYSFDTATGRITGISLYKDADAPDKIRGWIYSVHVGSWGGMLTRILWFLAALMGASLPLTGYYLWIKRLVKRR